jgi:hypothetical protein
MLELVYHDPEHKKLEPPCVLYHFNSDDTDNFWTKEIILQYMKKKTYSTDYDSAIKEMCEK